MIRRGGMGAMCGIESGQVSEGRAILLMEAAICMRDTRRDTGD